MLSLPISSHLNESPLYELNLIAKECSIEPIWKLTNSPNQEGDFEAEIKFEKLVGFGKGRKKQDVKHDNLYKSQAKREAASQIISQIRSNPALKDKFNPKSSKLSSNPLIYQREISSLDQAAKSSTEERRKRKGYLKIPLKQNSSKIL